MNNGMFVHFNYWHVHIVWKQLSVALKIELTLIESQRPKLGSVLGLHNLYGIV